MSEGAPTDIYRPSVDASSTASSRAGKAAGVLLTGMGRDGAAA
jgi:chemotaxis response regulator CheB